jgi:hypothetical protein
MALIQCVLTVGKLEVVKVVKFEVGDKIKLDKPMDFNGKPADCLDVRVPFGPGRKMSNNFVLPCPGNKPVKGPKGSSSGR